MINRDFWSGKTIIKLIKRCCHHSYLDINPVVYNMQQKIFITQNNLNGHPTRQNIARIKSLGHKVDKKEGKIRHSLQKH